MPGYSHIRVWSCKLLVNYRINTNLNLFVFGCLGYNKKKTNILKLGSTKTVESRCRCKYQAVDLLQNVRFLMKKLK